MKSEMESCTILKNSIIAQGGLAYKIPDPANQFGSTGQRPFDLFGVFQGFPLYCEVKYMKKLQSFDLSRIEDHQIKNLLEYKKQLPNALCWIVLGIKVARDDHRFFIFKDLNEIIKRRDLKQNYLKKELESMNYCRVKKNLLEGDL